MLQLKNDTPYKADIALFSNEKGVDTLYLTVKATFELGEPVLPAERQEPVRLVDEYLGEPGLSSLKYASDVHLTKPSTDVIVTGSAHAPDGRPVASLDVAVRVGERQKTIRVFGDRKWYRSENDLRISSPEPFVTMPIVYERAFGGSHATGQKTLFEPRNPVGIGFMEERGPDEADRQPLPNLEDPSHLIATPGDRPPPACFGPIPPSWEPRMSFAGTFDEVWLKSRAPYLPDDFQSRFFNASHPDLAGSDYLNGGEQVEITNMTPVGILRFALPSCGFEVAVQIGGQTERPAINLETVLIEPEESRFSMVWRSCLECDKKALKVNLVTVTMKSEGSEGEDYA